jgi:entericidin B
MAMFAPEVLKASRRALVVQRASTRASEPSIVTALAKGPRLSIRRRAGKPSGVYDERIILPGTGLALDQPLHLSKKENFMLRTFFAVVLLAAFTAGCNTMAGAGKDVERGGEKIQGAAERNK